jgi:hypothetical protein
MAAFVTCGISCEWFLSKRPQSLLRATSTPIRIQLMSHRSVPPVPCVRNIEVRSCAGQPSSASPTAVAHAHHHTPIQNYYCNILYFHSRLYRLATPALARRYNLTIRTESLFTFNYPTTLCVDSVESFTACDCLSHCHSASDTFLVLISGFFSGISAGP